MASWFETRGAKPIYAGLDLSAALLTMRVKNLILRRIASRDASPDDALHRLEKDEAMDAPYFTSPRP
jgi:hypothetical protein